jgi:hypothetical protein
MADDALAWKEMTKRTVEKRREEKEKENGKEAHTLCASLFPRLLNTQRADETCESGSQAVLERPPC